MELTQRTLDQLQNIHPTKRTFADLAIGDTFDFVNLSQPMLNSFYRRCIKTSTRKYQAVDEPKNAYRVGSVKARVYHVWSPTDRLTLEQILDRDVPAIRDHARQLANCQGIYAPIHIYYRNQAIAGQSTATLSNFLETKGWKDSGIEIPCSVPYDKFWDYLYRRMGQVPIYAAD